MSRDKVYFISDLHLGARYITDARAHEARVVAFLEAIADDARELYLVGDVLDYWYEYRTAVPRGHVRFFGALARLADAGVAITWLTGNHDIWLFDYLRDEIGLRVVDGPLETEIQGTPFYIAHGDGVGHLKPSFRFIRSVFRNRVCQLLYSAIHPRWTIPFAHRWSAGSRGFAVGHTPSWHGSAREGVEAWARGFAASHPATRYIVLGHHHVVVDEPVGDDCRLIVLGDWIHHDSYGVFDGRDFKMCRFEHKSGTIS